MKPIYALSKEYIQKLFATNKQSVVCLLCKQVIQRGQAYYKGKKGGIICLDCLKEERQHGVNNLNAVLDEIGIDLTGSYYIHGYGKV
jgi:hypothetical protein